MGIFQSSHINDHQKMISKTLLFFLEQEMLEEPVPGEIYSLNQPENNRHRLKNCRTRSSCPLTVAIINEVSWLQGKWQR
jgi:hypothetical protein